MVLERSRVEPGRLHLQDALQKLPAELQLRRGDNILQSPQGKTLQEMHLLRVGAHFLRSRRWNGIHLATGTLTVNELDELLGDILEERPQECRSLQAVEADVRPRKRINPIRQIFQCSARHDDETKEDDQAPNTTLRNGYTHKTTDLKFVKWTNTRRQA